MEKLQVQGMQELTDREMAKIDGGFIGFAIAVGRGIAYASRIPAVRSAAVKVVRWGAAAVGAKMGWDLSVK
jgi:hypothetical protein